MSEKKISRRDFVSTVTIAAAGAVMPRVLSASRKTETVETVRDVIDLLIATSMQEPFAGTVDTIKSADPEQPVRGIVTTFMANTAVIKRVIELEANLIVTHEPTFYNHRDETDWLTDDAVYQHKRKMLEENNIVVFRYHDYIHSIDPDPVRAMVVKKLGWTQYAEPENDNVYKLPATTVADVVKIVQQKLGSKRVRLVGDSNMKCERIGILVGAPGGRRQISFISSSKVDVLIAGEIAVWETSEYIRDAISAGQKKALIVAGHANTEEHGMEWLAGWLKERLPQIPVHHIPGNEPFLYR